MTRTVTAVMLVLAAGCGEHRRAAPDTPVGPSASAVTTWSISGTVTDSLIVLADATVEIIDGVGSGKSIRTGPGGAYQFAGLTGDVQVRASKPGFEAQVRTVRPSSAQTVVNFGLAPVNPANVSGAWRLTIQASPSCDTLPEKVRTRTYRAVIHQSGARATVALEDDTVVVSLIEAVVQENTVRVLVGRHDYDPRDGFRDRIAPDTVLAILGWVPDASLSPSRISGLLDGSIGTYEVPTNATLEELLRPGQNSVSCHRTDHRFTLER